VEAPAAFPAPFDVGSDMPVLSATCLDILFVSVDLLLSPATDWEPALPAAVLPAAVLLPVVLPPEALYASLRAPAVGDTLLL